MLFMLPASAGGQSINRKRPNWLFRCLIFGSIGLHTILFFHVAAIYRSQAMNVIELSIRGESVPQRDIPRPSPRPQNRLQPPDKIVPIAPRQAPPSLKPIQMASVQAILPDGVGESIRDTPGVYAPPTRFAAFEPVSVPDFSLETFDSPESYLEMVRFRIEKHKRYPEKARMANMRGRVTVTLLITLQGEIGSLAIKTSSGHALLDEAAIAAVQRAVLQKGYSSEHSGFVGNNIEKSAGRRALERRYTAFSGRFYYETTGWSGLAPYLRFLARPHQQPPNVTATSMR